jgi:hypothetical protein
LSSGKASGTARGLVLRVTALDRKRSTHLSALVKYVEAGWLGRKS